VQADRGSQYPSEAFTQLLDRTLAIASLSRPGNPYENALAESSWSMLKTEPLLLGQLVGPGFFWPPGPGAA